MITPLAKLVNLTYDVQENKEIIHDHHGAKCPGLSEFTNYCDMLADGANLCARAHSKHWWTFVHCMYTYTTPTNKDKDKGNPLANVTTFDTSVTGCAISSLLFEDYDVIKFAACIHGPEAADLREISAAKVAADMKAGKPDTMWVEVNGTFVQAPLDRNVTRDAWTAEVRSAICDAASAHKSEPEVKPIWDTECASQVVV